MFATNRVTKAREDVARRRNVHLAVGGLIYCGRSWVTTVLAFWSLLLYAVFLSYLAAVFMTLEPTAAGASGLVDGIFEPEPMCMLIVILVSLHASRNGSQ